MSVQLRPLTDEERRAVEAALRQNARGGENAAVLIDPRTTRFAGTGKVEPVARQIQAIKDVPTHYTAV